MRIRPTLVFVLASLTAIVVVGAGCTPPPSAVVPDPPEWILDVKAAASDGSQRVVMSGKGCAPNVEQGMVVEVDEDGVEGAYYPRDFLTDADGSWVVDEFTALPGHSYTFTPHCTTDPWPPKFVSKTLET